MSIETPGYVAMKLHGGSGYTVPLNAVAVGQMVADELDGMQAEEKITITFTFVDMSAEQYEALGEFDGH